MLSLMGVKNIEKCNENEETRTDAWVPNGAERSFIGDSTLVVQSQKSSSSFLEALTASPNTEIE